MANLLDGIKEAIVEMLRPGFRQETGELAALRELYDPANSAGGLIPSRWYRLHNQNGNCVGFSFVCNCGREWQMLSAFEWARDYECPQCRAKFDLYRFAGVTDAEGKFKVLPKEIETLLSRLPVRPRTAGKPAQAPRVVDTWDDRAGDVVYEGTGNTGFGM